MAVYSNLPVFKASYDLVIEVYGICNHLHRDYKYTLGEKLKNTLIDLMVEIYKAHLATDKLEDVQMCRRQVVAIKIYLRLLHDLKQLSVKRFAILADKMDIISRQLTAWHKSVENKRGEEERRSEGVSASRRS